MDNFEKIYMQSIQLANKNGGLNEGLASNIIKAGLKVAAKTGKKIAEKTGKNIAKKTGSKTAGKIGEKLISKTASKLTAAQAKELVKKVTNTMNKSKILKMLSKKHYVRTLIAADFLDEHTKDFKTAFELLTVKIFFPQNQIEINVIIRIIVLVNFPCFGLSSARLCIVKHTLQPQSVANHPGKKAKKID